MIGYARESDGAEIDRVVAPDLLETVLRHHAAVAREIFAAPGERVPAEANVVLPAGRFQDAQSLRNDLLADAVAWNDSDLVFFHSVNSSRISGVGCARPSTHHPSRVEATT